jgi:hypothetical protein
VKQFILTALLVLSTVAACGSTTLTPTGQRFPPHSPQCQVQVYTAMPASGFFEIGTIDVQYGAYGSNTYRDIESFTREIRPYVCQAGGDAAIAFSNGLGMYIKATVLKAGVAPAMTAAPAPAAVPAPATQQAPRAPAGCQFDTQCKGDRICVNGACVAPTPTYTAS